jgi:hypothetical protein
MQFIKDNGKEEEAKRICRYILFEAYMKEDKFEEARFLMKEIEQLMQMI